MDQSALSIFTDYPLDILQASCGSAGILSGQWCVLYIEYYSTAVLSTVLFMLQGGIQLVFQLLLEI